MDSTILATARTAAKPAAVHPDLTAQLFASARAVLAVVAGVSIGLLAAPQAQDALITLGQNTKPGHWIGFGVSLAWLGVNARFWAHIAILMRAAETHAAPSVQARLPRTLALLLFFDADGGGLSAEVQALRSGSRMPFFPRTFLVASLMAGMVLMQSAHASETSSACAYLARLVPPDGQPLFLPSYPTIEAGPLRGVAFLYDNAVVAIALVGCGEAGRARRIGDAILAGLDHDRAWHDGRLRNAYAAGSVADDPVKLGGWWDEEQGRWLEDSYQVGSDAGNLAWATLALLALDRATGDPRYRAGAVRIGDWLAGRADDRGAGGFTGGYQGWEPSPRAVSWKSTEHNTDLAAAFRLLASATGNETWSGRVEHASGFVSAMWDDQAHAFATGTGNDGITRNPLLALDANIWPLLAIPGVAGLRAPDIIATIDARLRSDGGYAYSEAGPGAWIEGTGQAAILQKLLGHGAEATALLQSIDSARAPTGGYFATLHATVATGFADPANPNVERYYLHIPHLAAAGWAALAERAYNPFTLNNALP